MPDIQTLISPYIIRLPFLKRWCIVEKMSSLCVSSCVLQPIFVLLNVNPEAHINELQPEPPHPKTSQWTAIRDWKGFNRHGSMVGDSWCQIKLSCDWHELSLIPFAGYTVFRQRMRTQEKPFGSFPTGNVNHASWTCFRLLHLVTGMEDDGDVTISKSAEHIYLMVSSLCAGAAKENMCLRRWCNKTSHNNRTAAGPGYNQSVTMATAAWVVW